MASDTAANFMSVRLLINEKTGKILYAEAGKDFVDLLFNFFTLPTGSVIKLLSALKRTNRVGCLTNLYKGVEKLQSMFMNADKSQLLDPNFMSAPTTVYYVCGYNRSYGDTHYMTTRSGGTCACGGTMSCEVQPAHNPSNWHRTPPSTYGAEPLQPAQNPFKAISTNSAGISRSGSSERGYVKETVTFIITNELEISPASAITGIKLLKKLNCKDLADLDERNASVGPSEALELLCAGMVSATALEDVFGGAASACSQRPEVVPGDESYETAEIVD